MKIEQLKSLVDQGKSAYEIAEILDKGHTTIRYWLKKYNLKTQWEAFKKKERFGSKSVCKKHGLSEYNNKGRCRKCATEAVQKRRDKLKQKSVEYKGNKCEKCGYDKFIGALEFHHIDPNEKDFGISYKGYTRSWNKVKLELDKCKLLCANCHREEHAGIA